MSYNQLKRKHLDDGIEIDMRRLKVPLSENCGNCENVLSVIDVMPPSLYSQAKYNIKYNICRIVQKMIENDDT